MKVLACTSILVFVLAGSAAAVACRTVDVSQPDAASPRFDGAPRSVPSRSATTGAFRIDAIAESFFIDDREHDHSMWVSRCT
jgi:hypothetical protein